MADWVYLIIGVAVLGVALVVGLLSSGRGRRVTPPRADADVIAAPPAEAEVAAPREAPSPALTLEKPEGTASRVTRLRQRLARSQGGLGRGLLALLSRDRLDEDTWEEIEDSLLTADIGVGPTQELVERLRTRLRVEGSAAAPAKDVLRDRKSVV